LEAGVVAARKKRRPDWGYSPRRAGSSASSVIIRRNSFGWRAANGAAQNCFRRRAGSLSWSAAGGARRGGGDMANDKQPTVIKKYANRRLYNTGASVYVTLEDLAQMVKNGEDFQVFDAKTNEDITRSVLTQIIFEQEGKDGQSLLPIDFLRQLIRFYGDSMQMLVPSYLQFSLEKFVAEQQKMREQMTSALGVAATPGGQMFSALEEQTRKNMTMFNEALGILNPFMPPAPKAPDPKPAEPAPGEFDFMKKQLAEMQKMIEALAKKG
jgi:polyhydroxyalkanoate synthesis repressor PhaR